MNRHTALIFGIIAAFILAWWAGFHFYGENGDRPERRAERVTTVEVESTNTDTAQTSEPEIERTSTDNLGFVDWSTDTESETPKACFTFSETLGAADNVKIRDYYRVSPNTPVTASIIGSQLCLTGLAFDSEYEVTLLEGLPSASGQALERDRTVTVSFGDKPAYVAFAGEGIILPRVNAQGLAIETINVDELTVEIARVTDRMMARRDPESGKATVEGEYSWEYEDAATNIREDIWKGELSVKSVRNQKVTTVLPINDLVGELAPGAYVVTAERKHGDEEDRVARAWRWIISTDLALTSYNGADGLTLSVRSIETANLQSNIRLTLVAQNNSILGETRTGADGRAKFAAPLLAGTGPKTAKMVMAYGPDGDYAMLDLERAPLDLSEFAVDGRSVTGPVDVYGFAERGAYRPGETAYLTIMLRDNEAMSVSDRPVTLSVKRPNGIEMFIQRFTEDEIETNAGTISWDYEIPTSAPRGVWTVDVKVDGVGNAGQIEFSVEDFVPQKLRLGIEASDDPIRSNDIRDVNLDAQFLYGAPGAALEGEAEARLRLDPNPFKRFEDYQFGPADQDFEERFVDIGSGITDAAGKLALGLDIKNEYLNSPYPLRAEITAGVAEPGGRYVRDSTRVPLRTEDSYLGIKPLFKGTRAPRGKPVELAIIAVDYTGERIAKPVKWSLIEEDWDYHWYRDGGRWRYRRDVRDVPIVSGELDVSAAAPASWSHRLNWGDYRLDIEGEDGTVAGYRFSVGWGNASKSDAPDQIRMAASEELLNAGDNIKLSVNAPYAGEGELVIANDGIQLIKTVRLPEGGSEISVPFDAAWGESVYAMLTLYTPRDAVGRPVPRRAVGVSYIALDRTDQTLALTIDAPEVIRPRQEHIFTVDVKNAPAGETVWMNFAAVDEGILQITKYKSPSADGFFFGKKTLSVELRDDYSRMLNPNLGAPAIANSGGDGLGGEGLTVVPTRTVALYEGPVKVKGGKARIALDIPDFNGELRLMATAWSGSAVGSASNSVKIRDKVPTIVGLPRFLAPGDKAFATVSLDNVEGSVGTYTAELTGTDVMTTGAPISLELGQGERREQKIPLAASDIGVDNLTLNVNGPGRYAIKTNYPIQTRTPYMPVTTAKSMRIAAGADLMLTPKNIEGFLPGSTDITVSFSQLAGLDPAPYVDSLARYPYGCTEQTVSSAMPLLYVEDLGGFKDLSDAERKRGLNKAVAKLASRQGLDGAFGLWREGDSYASPWLGAYVTDFLQRADQKGFYVPAETMKRANKALKEISRMPRYPNLQYDFRRPYGQASEREVTRYKIEAASYAHYVLAKGGNGDLSGLRYLFDNHREKVKTPVASAYLASALSMMGDKSRAALAFEQGLKQAGYKDDDDYYQSELRDMAGYIAAAIEANENEIAGDVVERFKDELLDVEYLNTQQKAYVILALRGLMASTSAPSVRAENADLSNSKIRPSAHLYGKDLAQNPVFTNTGDGPVWASVTVSGSTLEAPEPVESGFNLTKTVYRMDGKRLTGGSVKQGERFIVSLTFNSTANKSRTTVLADLLPAGYEIETVLRPEDGARKDGTVGVYQWVGEISEFDVTEARDDRFIASNRTYRKDKYLAAYIVRAVTPGEFAMPGAIIEDMYRPGDHAITASSRITIMADPTL